MSYRKRWDDQIRNINDLRTGMIVVAVNSYFNEATRIKSFEEEYFISTDFDGTNDNHYYGDRNLKPYGRDNWNPTNYLRRPTTKELIEFKRKEKPKQEDNVEKSCETCDYSRQMEWNDAGCDENRNEPLLSCGIGDPKWKLRRDHNQENKEQEMSYKPTSKCTLKNIAAKIHETNCDEARIEFFEFIYKNHISRAERFDAILIKGEYKTTWKQWPDLIKNETRRNWLLKFGFIEEEIRLKPCPHCGETKYAGVVSARAMHDSDKYAYGDDYAMCCNHIKGGCGLHFGYEPSKQEAIKAWNTRK